MSVAISNMNTTVYLSSKNAKEKKEAKTFNCTTTVHEYELSLQQKTVPTVEQKQKYAECVQYLHPVNPIKTEQEVVLYKAASVLFLVSCLGAFIYMFETRRKATCRYKIDYVLMPVGFGMLVTAVVGFLAYAVCILFY